MIYIRIFPISCIILVDSVLSRMSSPIFRTRQNHDSTCLIMGHANMPRHIPKMLSFSHRYLSHRHLKRRSLRAKHRTPVPVLPVVLLHL